MADRLATSILVGISALKAAAALGSWYDNRRQSRTAYYATTADGHQIIATPVGLTEHIDKLFLVMSTLGHRLLALDAVDRELLPEVCHGVHKAFAKSSLTLSSAFDSLDEAMQFSVACAIAFCSACHPMHIYRGFGCGVLNDPKWANPEVRDHVDSDILLEMDDTIAYYKSIPRDFKFFWKSPSRISRVRPYYTKTSKANRDLYLSDIYSVYHRRGFPQPNDKSFAINTWDIPFATWNGKAMYEHHGHSIEDVLRWQLDPGRFLYAWTVGERLDLKPGEAIIPQQEHIAQLAVWLEGHRGMTFTVLYDHDLDDQHKFSYSTRKSLQASVGNPRGVSGKVAAIVADPRKMNGQHEFHKSKAQTEVSSNYLSVPQTDSMPYPSHFNAGSVGTSAGSPPPLYTASSWDSTTTTDSIRRRPVPETPPMKPPRPVMENLPKPDTLQELEFLTADELV